MSDEKKPARRRLGPSEVSQAQCRPFEWPWGSCLHGQYNKFFESFMLYVQKCEKVLLFFSLQLLPSGHGAPWLVRI